MVVSVSYNDDNFYCLVWFLYLLSARNVIKAFFLILKVVIVVIFHFSLGISDFFIFADGGTREYSRSYS